MKSIFISEGFRMLKRRLRIYKTGFGKYAGNDENICSAIVSDCYNKENNFFMTSTGHFTEFWTRDFGLCVQPLKMLGYKKEIFKTLEYALKIFKQHGQITTTINPNDKSFDFPKFSPDSLAFMLHSLVVSGSSILVSKHTSFLEREIADYAKIVVDKETGLVKRKHFGSMKDHSIRKSSCYDNVMVAWVSKNADLLGLKNPLGGIDYQSLIKKHFWKEDHFIDDLSGKNILSGDANTYPFWTGVFDSKDMIRKMIKSVKAKGLDKPFPIRYSIEKPKVMWLDIFAAGYEFQNIWPMSGYPFIEVVSKVDNNLAKKYLAKYKALIEEHKTFLEVYNNKGKPFKTYFYMTDEGMLWASMHLYLKKCLSRT